MLPLFGSSRLQNDRAFLAFLASILAPHTFRSKTAAFVKKYDCFAVYLKSDLFLWTQYSLFHVHQNSSCKGPIEARVLEVFHSGTEAPTMFYDQREKMLPAYIEWEHCFCLFGYFSYSKIGLCHQNFRSVSVTHLGKK